MKRLFLIGSFLLHTLFCFSQSFTLQGTVTKDGRVFPGVNVLVKDSERATMTDIDGHYELELPRGDYTLVFSHGNQKTVTVHLNNDKILNIDMTGLVTSLDEVFLSSLRVDADSPITHSNLGHEEINERNLGQDIPILMKYMPNVTTTSDAGAGVGYTGIRVRGSDATRVNVTINGVPMNDAESQSTIWVDLGDFTSSIE